MKIMKTLMMIMMMREMMILDNDAIMNTIDGDIDIRFSMSMMAMVILIKLTLYQELSPNMVVLLEHG